MLSPAGVSCFPGVTVCGESLGCPGTCPGSCQALPKPRGHPPPSCFVWLGRQCTEAPPGGRPVPGERGEEHAARVSTWCCVKRNTAVLDLCWIPCELLAPGGSVSVLDRAVLLWTIAMVALRYIHQLFDTPPFRGGALTSCLTV